MSAPPTRRAIQRLDPATVDRIAAGEVVERPASVVKELVENAVDAGATKVTVRLNGGGLERIEVADDGHGIPAGELDLALERHATSKLLPSSALDAIGTLGFRGEALAAIAAVSRLRLRSRPPEAEAASGVRVDGGSIVGRFEAGRSIGTTVEVEELFYNTPARRKFLHAPAMEQVEVMRTLDHLYLARPTVALTIELEGREAAAYPATTDLSDAGARVLGPEFLLQSFRVEAPLASGGRLVGVLGRPALAASSSRGLYLAVNGRAVSARAIAEAVRAAFYDYLPRHRYPIGVLHLELPLHRVDVNVHPTKREIRFAKESEIGDAVREGVRRALREAPAPKTPPATAPAPSPLARRGPPPEPPAGPTAAPPGRTRTLPGLGPPVQRSLDGAPGAASVAGPDRGRMTLFGCVDALYWIGSDGDGLLLIDQHAASERLLFDRLRGEGRAATQELVTAVRLRLTPTQAEALRAHAKAIEEAGFTVEPFGGEYHRVTAVPSGRGWRVRAETVTTLLDELANGARPTVPDGTAERTLATIACHAAIRAGDAVSSEEFSRVLAALAQDPATAPTCPHGRPIFLRFPRARLDRWFLRSPP